MEHCGNVEDQAYQACILAKMNFDIPWASAMFTTACYYFPNYLQDDLFSTSLAAVILLSKKPRVISVEPEQC